MSFLTVLSVAPTIGAIDRELMPSSESIRTMSCRSPLRSRGPLLSPEAVPILPDRLKTIITVRLQYRFDTRWYSEPVWYKQPAMMLIVATGHPPRQHAATAEAHGRTSRTFPLQDRASRHTPTPQLCNNSASLNADRTRHADKFDRHSAVCVHLLQATTKPRYPLCLLGSRGLSFQCPRSDLNRRPRNYENLPKAAPTLGSRPNSATTLQVLQANRSRRQRL